MGRRRLAFWFENAGRHAAEARRLAERLHARKTAIMRDLIAAGQVQARPGVHRLLDELDAAGVPMHVATTGTRAWVEPFLDRVFGPRFQTVVTGTEVTDLKPSPAAYQEVSRRTGCPVDRTVAVEDSAERRTRGCRGRTALRRGPQPRTPGTTICPVRHSSPAASTIPLSSAGSAGTSER